MLDVIAPNKQQTPPPINATNVYAYTEEGWRMIAHHATTSQDVAEPDTGESHTLH